MKYEIPYKKLSKKKQKEINKKQRNFWPINPITRVIENKKKNQIYVDFEDYVI